MKRLYLSALYMLVCFTKPTLSQEVNPGPRLGAMGNSGVALSDTWSLQANQAGLTGLEKPIVALSYRSSYLQRDLSTRSAALIYPVGRNTFGLSVQAYGFSAYREQRISFACARSFGPSLSLSVALNRYQLIIEQYGSGSRHSIEVGMQYRINEYLRIGSHIANPTRTSASTDLSIHLPVVLQVGAAYQFSDKVLASTAIVNTVHAAAEWRFGLEYEIVAAFALRGGAATHPFQQFAGFGCDISDLKIDAAVSSHPLLGYSPQIAFSYAF
jgi:hypothetical protein